MDPVLEENILDAEVKSEVDVKPQVDLSAKSLLVPTSEPINFPPFEFGGDDTQNPAVTQ